MNKISNDFIKRLMLSGASFLSLEEKLFLLKCDADLTELDLVELSVLLRRSLGRVKYNKQELYRNAYNSSLLLQGTDIKVVFFDDENYPVMLREMKDPPFALFYRGNLEILNKKCVSVVGTRRCGLRGKNAAVSFSRSACDDDSCVVSGLAWGIDAFAHKGALESEKSCTCAVLPSGIDTIVPSVNKKLAEKILQKNGLIISEYLPGTPAMAFRFVQRNRIVAALSAETVVIQAPPGSGAMITASMALDYNRSVYFHKECFSPEGIAISEISELQLRKELAQQKKVEYKINNSPKSFVEDGAQIISDYDDFKIKRNLESIHQENKYLALFE